MECDLGHPPPPKLDPFKLDTFLRFGALLRVLFPAPVASVTMSLGVLFLLILLMCRAEEEEPRRRAPEEEEEGLLPTPPSAFAPPPAQEEEVVGDGLMGLRKRSIIVQKKSNSMMCLLPYLHRPQRGRTTDSQQSDKV